MSVVSHYQQLHRIPEVSGQEHCTAQYIIRVLSEAGYIAKRIGDTGVIADLVSGAELPWLILRADMDALPIQEATGLPFASEHPGVMHACGHDAHCAMLLAAAQQLKGKKLPHNIRMVFQPAEETTLGAGMMIGQGIIPENTIACFAIHVWPGLEQGQLFTKPGALMASSDILSIRIMGSSAHCAQSHLGANALQTAVSIVSAFPEIREKAIDKRTLLFCGSVHSGSSHNIVPNAATISGTLRAFSAEDRRNIKQQLEQKSQDIAQMYKTTAVIEWDEGCPMVNNDPELIHQLQECDPTLNADTEATLAGEDFARFQEHAPGVMLWLGTGKTPPLHNNEFYVPEAVLAKGVAAWLNIAAHKWMK